MKKTTNEEKESLEELADKYVQKINEDREMVHNALNKEQQLFLKGANTKIADELREHLKSGKNLPIISRQKEIGSLKAAS